MLYDWFCNVSSTKRDYLFSNEIKFCKFIENQAPPTNPANAYDPLNKQFHLSERNINSPTQFAHHNIRYDAERASKRYRFRLFVWFLYSSSLTDDYIFDSLVSVMWKCEIVCSKNSYFAQEFNCLDTSNNLNWWRKVLHKYLAYCCCSLLLLERTCFSRYTKCVCWINYSQCVFTLFIWECSSMCLCDWTNTQQ